MFVERLFVRSIVLRLALRLLGTRVPKTESQGPTSRKLTPCFIPSFSYITKCLISVYLWVGYRSIPLCTVLVSHGIFESLRLIISTWQRMIRHCFTYLVDANIILPNLHSEEIAISMLALSRPTFGPGPLFIRYMPLDEACTFKCWSSSSPRRSGSPLFMIHIVSQPNLHYMPLPPALQYGRRVQLPRFPLYHR